MSFDNMKNYMTTDKWTAKLEEDVYIQRSQMNNLIMNYLVTGTQNFIYVQTFNLKNQNKPKKLFFLIYF